MVAQEVFVSSVKVKETQHKGDKNKKQEENKPKTKEDTEQKRQNNDKKGSNQIIRRYST